jgi:hypothetical protein
MYAAAVGGSPRRVNSKLEMRGAALHVICHWESGAELQQVQAVWLAADMRESAQETWTSSLARLTRL